MKLINYPAMASPNSIEVIDSYMKSELSPGSRIIDPFCGTGRLLLSPRVHGHHVTGVDCSPIAILTARVLHQKNSLERIANDFEVIISKFDSSSRRYLPNEDESFWFPSKAYSDLRRMLSIIDCHASSTNSLRFFWLCLVEASRVASFIREEEYKTHRIKYEQRKEFSPAVKAIFVKTYNKFFCRLNNDIPNMIGGYRLVHGDVSNTKTSINEFDAIITSPPYGDSISTVGYGQFARIPLILLSYSEKFCDEFISNSKLGSLDTFCLGGSNCFYENNHEIPDEIKYLSKGPMMKFCYDYFYRLNLLSSLMKKDALCCFILADRTYRKEKFPLISSTIRHMESLGFTLLACENRFLSWKRLPRTMQCNSIHQPNLHEGMNYESAVIMKRLS